MKKIKAFFIALASFAIVVLILHFTLARSISNNKGFGTWVNLYKDLSYSAISDNIGKDTVMMMGSSEFQHGRNSKYHPTKLFRRMGVDVMCIGAAYNQSLSHAITLGSVSEKMKKHKVVLLLSPAWFDNQGVKKDAFSVRFSETQFIALMQNPKLSKNLKRKIANRTIELLANDKGTRANVEMYAKYYIDGKLSPVNRAYIKMRENVLNERERININSMWRLKGQKEYEQFKKHVDGKVPNWDEYKEQADAQYFKKATNNPYGIINRTYNRKFAHVDKSNKNKMKERKFRKDSPEYKDLELFLEVCKESDVDVMLVLLPINGKWYDHMGFRKEARSVLPGQIKEIADKYDVKWYSFYNKDYTAGFLQDVFHPAGKGWTEINERAYKFFTEKSSSNKK